MPELFSGMTDHNTLKPPFCSSPLHILHNVHYSLHVLQLSCSSLANRWMGGYSVPLLAHGVT